MQVQMSKFNTVLNGRPNAREAALRIHQIGNGTAEKEGVVLDFSGVEVLSPSYADELIQVLKQKYQPEKIKFENTSTVVAEVIQAVNK